LKIFGQANMIKLFKLGKNSVLVSKINMRKIKRNSLKVAAFFKICISSEF
jgi:hypothetical protein